ncbi:hypothetical protein [Amycolatopsis ruanii]|nr:hypothetical protein [Amycolatopsis ruanii]
MQEPGGGLLLANHLADVSTDVRDEGPAEADGGVVRFDGILDQEDVDVRCVAGTALLVAAEEVGVGGALGVHDVLEDHASGSAGALAASAEQ